MSRTFSSAARVAFWGLQPALWPPLFSALTPAAAAAPAAEADKGDLKESQRLYGLAEGEVLKRVPRPFPACRLAVFRRHNPALAPVLPMGPGAMYLPYAAGAVEARGYQSTGDGVELGELPRMLGLGVYPQEIEGEADLRKARVSGDFVFRKGAAPEKIIGRLDEILKGECRLPFTVRFAEADRKVFVATGRFRFVPVPGRPPEQMGRIELYATRLTGKGGGGGGDFDTFLKWAGMFVRRQVVAGQVTDVPKGRLTCNYNVDYDPATKGEREGCRDAEAVLRHLKEQTGLTFKEERRRVRVLLIERQKQP